MRDEQVGHPPAAAVAVGVPERALLLQRLGVSLDDDLLGLALTHRSYAYENGGLPTNERLEFLGDAVLQLVVTDALYRRFPGTPEGQLAKLRAAVVNMRSLAGLARGLDCGPHVLLGRGEVLSGGQDKSSILADTLEALIGATYLEHGLQIAAALVHRLVDDRLESSAALGAGLDWKTSLQERTALLGLGAPEYVITEDGPDHAKTFHAVAVVAGRSLGEGDGRSKKEAEQFAASQAFTALERLPESESGPASGPDDGTSSGAPAANLADA